MKYNNARGGGDEGTVHDNKQYIGGARKKPGGERRWGKEEMEPTKKIINTEIRWGTYICMGMHNEQPTNDLTVAYIRTCWGFYLRGWMQSVQSSARFPHLNHVCQEFIQMSWQYPRYVSKIGSADLWRMRKNKQQTTEPTKQKEKKKEIHLKKRT